MKEERTELQEAAAASPALTPNGEAAKLIEERLRQMTPLKYEQLIEAVRTASSASTQPQKFLAALVEIAKFGVLAI